MLTRHDPMVFVYDAATRQRNRTRDGRRLDRQQRRRLRRLIGFATMIGLLFHMRNSKVNTRQFLGLEEALTLLRSIVSPVEGAAESVPLADAIGRVTAETIVAPMDVPPFFASAMDGYAICGSDPIFKGKPPYLLPVQGESRAGLPLAEVPGVNHAVRIFTGAVMPERCDTVVIQEHVQRHDANIVLQARPIMQTNVRPPGHDIAAAPCSPPPDCDSVHSISRG